MVRQSKYVIASHYYEVHMLEILEYGIEVLDIIHSASSIRKIRNARNIRL